MTELERIKAKIEALQRESDRAAGALERVNCQLMEEYRCKSIKAGKSLLRKLRAKLERQERELKAATETFRSKWSDRL